MRSLRIAAFLACCALAACKTSGGAYGQSGDERLEAAVSEKGSTEGAEEASKEKYCSDLTAKVKDNKSEEKPEPERLKSMSELFVDAKTRALKMEEAVAKNTDLMYSEKADVVKANLEECRSVAADTRSDFDRLVREICELPVIQEVQGQQKVNVPRLDFTLLRAAITTLDPDDKDTLFNKVDLAEKKTGGKKAAAATPPADGKKK